MAKSLKAPGSNGSATVFAIVDALKARAEAQASHAYWRDRIVTSALSPVARLLGESVAREILAYVDAEPVNASVGLSHLGRGLGLRGEREAAQKAVAEARAEIQESAIDGEQGTIAWNAVARALHSLGEHEATELALDEAQMAAGRETANPTQPWPHFAIALVQTGRLARLAELLGGMRPNDISFDVENAARAGVARAVAQGDLQAYGALHDVLIEEKTYTLYEGIRRGAADALASGRSRALLDVMARFRVATTHASDLGAELGLTAAHLGDRALGMEFLNATRAQVEVASPALSRAFETLGDDAAAAAAWERVPVERRAPRAIDATLGRSLALLLSDRPALAETVIAECIERAKSDSEGALKLCTVGLGLIGTTRDAQGRSLLEEAVATADAMPKKPSGWQRNSLLKEIAQACADAGQWAPALKGLRCCGGKMDKMRIALHLAHMYADRSDFAGAAMALGSVPATELKGLMNVADVLLRCAGEEPQWRNWA